MTGTRRNRVDVYTTLTTLTILMATILTTLLIVATVTQ